MASGAWAIQRPASPRRKAGACRRAGRAQRTPAPWTASAAAKRGGASARRPVAANARSAWRWTAMPPGLAASRALRWRGAAGGGGGGGGRGGGGGGARARRGAGRAARIERGLGLREPGAGELVPALGAGPGLHEPQHPRGLHLAPAPMDRGAVEPQRGRELRLLRQPQLDELHRGEAPAHRVIGGVGEDRDTGREVGDLAFRLVDGQHLVHLFGPGGMQREAVLGRHAQPSLCCIEYCACRPLWQGKAATYVVMSGVLKLGNSRATSAIPLLARAREREADPEVQAVLEEGLAILRLLAPDPAERAAAAQTLRRPGAH